VNVPFKTVMLWGVSAISLVALASPMPDVATGLVLLLIVGVLLTHWKDYQVYLPQGEKN
jgi:hypothetical protein